MKGTVEGCFPLNKYLLCWPQHQLALIARDAKGPFTVNSSDPLFNQKGKPHKKYRTFGDFQNELLLRSTEILLPIEPAAAVFKTFPIPTVVPDGQIPAGPAWPHTHTLDVSADAVYVQTGRGICRVDQVTITGQLQWQRRWPQRRLSRRLAALTSSGNKLPPAFVIDGKNDADCLAALRGAADHGDVMCEGGAG
jgi:hypothetical protein